MLRGNILDLEKRNDIYSFILTHPGLHLNELSRKLKIPMSTLYYHLNYLKKREMIISELNGRYKRYYAANKVGENDKKILNFLRQEVPFEIVMFLFLKPNSSRIKISKNLKKHTTTISFHIEKLMDLGIIEGISVNGNGMEYKIKNQETLSDIIIKYRKSLFRLHK